jgi:hypothetical protein
MENKINKYSEICCLVMDCVNNSGPACNLKVMGVGLDGKCTGLIIVKVKKKPKK